MSLRSVLFLTYHFPPSAAVGAHGLLGFRDTCPSSAGGTVVVAPPRFLGSRPTLACSKESRRRPCDLSRPLPSGIISKPVRRAIPYGIWLPRALAGMSKGDSRTSTGSCTHFRPPTRRSSFGARIFAAGWACVGWLIFATPGCGRPIHAARYPTAVGGASEAAVMRDADAIVANTPRACELLRERSRCRRKSSR